MRDPMEFATVMAVRKPTNKKGVAAATPYTSKIIKASALLGDTKTLLSHWDMDATVPENLDRISRENIFAKASRSRVKDILAVFRQRYLVEGRGHEGPSRAGEEPVSSGQP